MITIFAVTDGFKHFGEAINEYGKRLGKTILLKPIRPISHTNPDYIRTKETSLIVEHLSKTSGSVYILDECGKGIDTVQFAKTIDTARLQGEDLIFVIGGSYWMDHDIISRIPHTLIKISDFVMPHSLALLVLIEQIYRAHEIIKGSKYHHS